MLDANPNWSPETADQAGWQTATSDNSQIIVWSIDLQGGGIALSRGAMVRNDLLGFQINDDLVVHAPGELHVPPTPRPLDSELLAALYNVFSGKDDATHAALARSLATTTSWLAQAWRNTESIRQGERIVMLKTGFEALLDESTTWRAADKLRDLFDTLRRDGMVSDITAEYLLWKPAEQPTRVWTENGTTYACTDLQHWFRSLGEVRNRIIHDGDLPSAVYDEPASAYNGPYVFVGERLLRESCRVELRKFGYEELWVPQAFRALRRLFRQDPPRTTA